MLTHKAQKIRKNNNAPSIWFDKTDFSNSPCIRTMVRLRASVTSLLARIKASSLQLRDLSKFHEAPNGKQSTQHSVLQVVSLIYLIRGATRLGLKRRRSQWHV
jgi:hypothetical protein